MRKTRDSSTNDQTSLAEVPNLGPKSAQMLALAGITTLGQLRELGAIAAYVSAKRAGANVSLNLLWGLEAALTGMHWREVARAHRTSLLLALDQFENGA
jgi:TfoX-like protein